MSEPLAEQQQRMLQELARFRKSLAYFGKTCLKIRDKENNTIPFVMNTAQTYLHKRLEQQRKETGKVRALVLKGRQQGISTYTAARFYRKASLFKGVNVYILSHEQKATDNLFKMVTRLHTNNPVAPQTGKSNAKELSFENLDSSYAIATAGAKEGGRGRTPTLFHGCIHPDTVVLRPDHTVTRAGDMRLGDEVLTHNNHTARISYISRDTKELYAVKVMGASDPVLATLDHKFETLEGKKALRDLAVGDVLLHPVFECGNEELRLPYRLVYGRRPGRGGTGAVGPDTLLADFWLGRVLGLYLAEGHVRDNRVSFAIHERELVRTLEWLQPFRECWRSEPKVERRENSKTVTVTVNSKSFAVFVEGLCGRTTSKHVPNIWRRNADFARGLVVGYFAGDGGGQHRNGVRVQAPSICPAISFAMRDILAATGYGWATITRRDAGLRHGRQEREQWTVRLSGVGADRLWEEMGRQPFERTKAPHPKKMRIEGGFAQVPILSIEPHGVGPTVDFEVDHPDHSFRLWQCASSNSEAAFWQNAQGHFASSVQGVPDARGTEVILESTACGAAGEYFERWNQAEAGDGDYIPIFIPWMWQAEYARPVGRDFELSREALEGELSEVDYAEMFGCTMEQMAWRRAKIQELRSVALFNQEYPATATLAFQSSDGESYIKGPVVLRARKRTDIVGGGPLIFGVDPAGEGGDRFAVAMRRGHECENIEWRNKITATEAVDWVDMLIQKHKPAMVNIDAGGLGAPLIDFLRSRRPEYVHLVNSVNFGSRSQHKNATPRKPGPRLRRDEMWLRMKEWLELEEGVRIPDIDILQTDLIGPRKKPSHNNDFSLESKDSMRARKVRSPDLADALALTFADLRAITVFTDKQRPDSYGSASSTDAPRVTINQRGEIVGGGGFGGNGWMAF